MSRWPTDAEARAEIVRAGHKLYARGLVASNDGNLSVRVGEDAVWVTPTAARLSSSRSWDSCTRPK